MQILQLAVTPPDVNFEGRKSAMDLTLPHDEHCIVVGASLAGFEVGPRIRLTSPASPWRVSDTTSAD